MEETFFLMPVQNYATCMSHSAILAIESARSIKLFFFEYSGLNELKCRNLMYKHSMTSRVERNNPLVFVIL